METIEKLISKEEVSLVHYHECIFLSLISCHLHVGVFLTSLLGCMIPYSPSL